MSTTTQKHESISINIRVGALNKRTLFFSCWTDLFWRQHVNTHPLVSLVPRIGVNERFIGLTSADFLFWRVFDHPIFGRAFSRLSTDQQVSGKMTHFSMKEKAENMATDAVYAFDQIEKE